MRLPEGLKIAVKNNDLTRLHAIYQKIADVTNNITKPQGFILIDPVELNTALFHFAIQSNAGCVMINQLLRAGCKYGAPVQGLISAVAANQQKIVASLLYAGVTLTDKDEKTEAYQQLSEDQQKSLKAAIKIHEVQREIESPSFWLSKQQRKNALLKKLQDSIILDPQAFANYLNNISSKEGRLVPVFNDKQWTEFYKLFEIISENIDDNAPFSKLLNDHGKELIEYNRNRTMPSQPRPEQAGALSAGAMADIDRRATEEINKIDKQALSREAIQSILAYLRSKSTTTATNSPVDFEMRTQGQDILAQAKSQCEFYLDQPAELSSHLNASQHFIATTYFNAQIAKALEKQLRTTGTQDTKEKIIIKTELPGLPNRSYLYNKTLRHEIRSAFISQPDVHSDKYRKKLLILRLDVIDQLRESLDINILPDTYAMERALLWAAETGKININDIKRLVAIPNININRRNRNNHTPLTLAACYGRDEIIECLLEQENINPDAKQDYGFTALMLAAANGRTRCVALLLKQENKDLLNAENDEGETALMLAVRGDHLDCVKLLLKQKGTAINTMSSRWYYKSIGYKSMSALMIAIEHNSIKSLKQLLLHKNTLINDTCELFYRESVTPLIFAVRKGRPECVELLLAQKNIQVNMNRKTALMYAADNNKPRCLALLLAHKGTNANAIHPYLAQTALIYAAKRGNTECVALLLAYKNTQVNYADENGMTALMHAAEDFGCLKLFIADQNVKIDAVDNAGNTALYYAHGCRKCVNLLMPKLHPWYSDKKIQSCLLNITLTDDSLKKELALIEDNPYIPKELRERYTAATHLHSAIQRLKTPNRIRLGSTKETLLRQSVKLYPTHLANFVNAIISDGAKNPFTPAQWNQFKKLVTPICNEVPNLQKPIDINLLKAFPHPDQKKAEVQRAKLTLAQGLKISAVNPAMKHRSLAVQDKAVVSSNCNRTNANDRQNNSYHAVLTNTNQADLTPVPLLSEEAQYQLNMLADNAALSLYDALTTGEITDAELKEVSQYQFCLTEKLDLDAYKQRLATRTTIRKTLKLALTDIEMYFAAPSESLSNYVRKDQEQLARDLLQSAFSTKVSTYIKEKTSLPNKKSIARSQNNTAHTNNVRKENNPPSRTRVLA